MPVKVDYRLIVYVLTGVAEIEAYLVGCALDFNKFRTHDKIPSRQDRLGI